MTLDRSRSPDRDRVPRFAPLLTGAGVLALAMGAGMARGAVAFQGNYSVGLGNVSLASNAATSTDTFTINSPTAILNWTPSDTGAGSAPIVFLPSGATGIFQGSAATGFTVLNTINPVAAGRPIEFDGHLVSQLVGATGAVSRGGNVWFYAPGGIIIGSTGVFDVGSLILTPNTIDVANGLPDPTTGIHFAGAAGSTAAVVIRPGAQINETAPGSYLAIVAPRINQGGAVTVNGSVGYIAAQAADVTINAGLFSIAASTAIGSRVAAGGETTLTHTGTTTGPAAAATGAPHIIYMTTIAQNDAVTMLVSGTVGYDAATGASQADGAIILAGNAIPTTGAPPTLASGPAFAGNIAITSGSFKNTVYADADFGTFSAVARDGDLAFAGLRIGQGSTVTLGAVNRHVFTASGDVLDDQVFAGNPGVSGAFDVTVDPGSIFDIAGALRLTSERFATSGGTYVGQPNTVAIGGTATVGSLALDASLDRGPAGTFSLVRGGDISMTVSGGGSLTVNGSATLTSNATATPGESAQTVSAGAVSIVVENGARAHFRNGLTLSASAPEAAAQTIGGVVQEGGTASLTASNGGTITVAGDVAVDATAATVSRPGLTQTAMGGTASIVADGGGMSFSGGNTVIDASAHGGNAVGGVARTSASGGPTLAYAGDLMLDASADNGASASAAAQGGTASMSDAGSGLSVTGTTTLRAIGDASAASGASASGTSAIGGVARISATGVAGATTTAGTTPGVVTLAGLATLDASALAYQGGDDPTGNAGGGLARIETTSAGAIGGGRVDLAGGALLGSSATANALGSGPGLAATGGTSAIDANNGAITFGGGERVEIAADARGGTATGGTAMLAATDGATITAGGATLSLHASAVGGTSGLAGGVGGGAAGGTVTLVVDDAVLTGGDWALASSATGGNGGDGASPATAGGAGGAASAGVVTAALSGGSADIAALSLENDATGGRGGHGGGYVPADGAAATVDGGDGGAGGQALSSGRTALTVDGGAFTATTLALRSTITGGRGGDGGDGFSATGRAPARRGAGGNGGAATGGDVGLTASAGTVSIVAAAGEPAPTTTIVSRGVGGDGGGGGVDVGSTGAAQAASGAAGAGGGGTAGITTAGAVTAMLADADIESGPTAGRAGAPGFVTISALDPAGDAPATPLSFTSLTAVAGGGSAGRALVIDSAAPIAVSGVTTLDTPGGVVFEASGRGGFSTGSLDVRSAASVASTQTDAVPGTFAISAGSATIDTASGGPIALSSFQTTGAGLDVEGGAFSADTLAIATALTGATSAFTLGTVNAGSIDLAAVGASTVGTAATTGDLVLATTGAGGSLGATALTSTQGSITLDATGDVTVPTLSAGDVVRATSDGAGHFGRIDAGTAIAAGAAQTSPDPGSILLHAAQNLTLDNALAPAGSIVLISEVGRIAAPALASGPGDPIVLLAGGATTIAGAVTAGTAGAPGALHVGGPQAVAGLGRRPNTSDVLAALGDRDLAPSGGAVGLGDVTAGSVDIAAGGALTAGALTATNGDVTATAISGDIAAGPVSSDRAITFVASAGNLAIGATSATDTVTLDAARTLTLASIDGTGIALNSADIAIAPGAAIGSTRTTNVALANTGTGRTVIGDGAGAAEGDYALSAAELASVHGTTISIGNTGAGADTLIGDLTLRGPAQSGGNLFGPNARFAVTNSGAIRIVGAARFTGLAADDTVALRSTAGDITGVLPAGSITLDDGNGGLAGTLALEADRTNGVGGTILFATPDAAGAVTSATDAAGIDAALGDPGALDNRGGYLRADTVSATFGNAFYTQNSGVSSAVADRAGVTAGAGGILLTPTTASAADPARLVLNAQLERDGATLTGRQVFDALVLQPTGFASGATLNACLLGATNCGVTGAITPAEMATAALVQSIQPVQDVAAQVQASTGLANNASYSFSTPILISTVGLGAPVSIPTIDEPVTGTGNDDLWVGIGVGRELAPMGGEKKPEMQPK